LDQYLGRDLKSFMKSANHGEGAWAVPAQYFGDAGAIADHTDQRRLIVT
jgi:hypothetical protein